MILGVVAAVFVVPACKYFALFRLPELGFLHFVPSDVGRLKPEKFRRRLVRGVWRLVAFHIDLFLFVFSPGRVRLRLCVRRWAGHSFIVLTPVRSVCTACDRSIPSHVCTSSLSSYEVVCLGKTGCVAFSTALVSRLSLSLFLFRTPYRP